MALFLIVSIVLGLAIYLVAYLNRPSGELTMEEKVIERKLALLPLPTPTPIPSPTPIPISAKRNSDELIEILYNKEIYGNGSERAAAARRLGELKAKSAVPVLLEMLGDKTWFASQDIRDACAISLGQIADPETIDELADAMKSGSIPAARALGMIASDESKAELSKYFRSIQDSKSQRQMILTLIDVFGNLKMEEAINPLVRAVKMQDYEIGSAALSSIRDIGDIHAVLSLIEMDDSTQSIEGEIIRTINFLLLKDRDFTTGFSDYFSEENENIWTTHKDHYRSAVIENGILALFSSIPDEQLELIGSKKFEGDYSLEVKFKRIKGKPDAKFGVLFGISEKERLEIWLSPFRDDEKQYFRLEIYRSRSGSLSRIFTETSCSASSAWSTIQIRIIDSIVTVSYDGRYLKSFRSTKTEGAIGFFVVGENHVAFDDLVIKKIEGPRVLSGQPEEKTEEEKYTPPKRSERSERKYNEREEKKEERRETPEPKGKSGKIIIDIQAEYVSVNEVVFKLDGDVLSRVSGENLKSEATKGLFNFRKVFSGRTQKDIAPGKHTLSGYVVGKKQTGGASVTFHIAPGETKRFSFVSEKDKDKIIAK